MSERWFWVKRILAFVLMLGVLGTAYIHVRTGQWPMLLGDAFFTLLMAAYTVNPPGDHDV